METQGLGTCARLDVDGAEEHQFGRDSAERTESKVQMVGERIARIQLLSSKRAEALILSN